MDKLNTFQGSPISYIETQQVKVGVECDIYAFNDTTSKDLAIIKVQKGFKTPLQRIVKGNKTIEGFLSGEGTLKIEPESGETKLIERATER